MKKSSVYIALGLVATTKAIHHKHHHKHAHQSTNQQLQQEIEQLRSAYNSLEEDYESLAQYTNKMKHTLAQGPSPYGNAGPNGRGPAYPSPQPFVRGEKQWMDNAQNVGDWGEQQEVVANTRIPYQSTAELEGPFGNAGGAGKGPTLPSPQPFVRGEKQWMDNAQNIGDWGENQMVVANTRIPYQSTAQAEGPFGNAGGAGKGPTLPSPQPFVRGEKQWMDNAQNIGDWGENQMVVANTRIPYQSTAQVEAPAPFGIAMEAGHIGGPALPSPQPFVRGEKQWMDNAQNIGDWGENQMVVANTRIPYQSTVQLEAPAPFGIAHDGAQLGGPALPSPQPFVRGEKQWMDNAQHIGDWGENQMVVANTRIPYASTLQLESEGPAVYGIAHDGGQLGGPAYPSPQPFVRGEKQWVDNAQNIEDWGIHQMEVANARIPYQSTLQLDSQIEGPALYGIATEAGNLGGPAYPSPQPFVRGEKQWMDNAQNIEDWGIMQMEVANHRIPYWSTLVQTADDNDEPDMSILYEKDEKDTNPEKLSTNQIPIDAHLIQTKDDDPSKMEGMLMEDPNIPLNLRLLQTAQNDDPTKMESMSMEPLEIPLNMRLVHVHNSDGDELIRII